MRGRPSPDSNLHRASENSVARRSEEGESMTDPANITFDSNQSAQVRSVFDFHALFRDRDRLPAWALSTRLSELKLRLRTQNAFRSANLHTVSDVLDFGEARVSSLRNFGVKSQSDFASCLQRLLNTGAEDGLTEGSETETEDTNLLTVAFVDANEDTEPLSVNSEAEPLRTLLEKALAALTPRDSYVLCRWLGLGSERTTLELLAVDLKLTRARLGQIKDRALRLAVIAQPWAPILKEKIASRLRDRNEPLYLDILSTEESWFSGFESDANALGRLIAAVLGRRNIFWRLEGRSLISLCQESQWHRFVQLANETAVACAAKRSSRDEVHTAITGIAIDAGALDLAPELWRVTSAKLQFSRDFAGQERLLSVGTSLQAMVSAVLQESACPLSLEDIKAQVSARGSTSTHANHYRTALSSCGALVFSGRRYGFERHLPVDAETMSTLARVSEAIVSSGPADRQWHCTELLEEAQSAWLDMPDDVDPYVLNAALLRARNLEPLGRLVWRRGQSKTANTSERLNIALLCTNALRDAGEPLTQVRLSRDVAKHRGLHTQFMPQPGGGMARLAPGVWGLIARDFDTTADERRGLLDALYAVLYDTETGLHFSELPALFPICHERPALMSGFAVLGLAQCDPRFRVGRGWLIGLSTWSDTRRPSLIEAVRQLARSRRYYRDFAALHSDLERALGRPVSEGQCARALAQAGYSFSDAAGLVRDVYSD